MAATQYATASDFLARFPAIAARATTAGLLTATFLSDASATADGYLQSNFTLPLLTWESDLIGKVCQIAAYYAMVGVGFKPGPNQADVNYKAIYDQAIAWLDGVGKGSIPIAATDSSAGGIEQGPLVLSDQSRTIEDPLPGTASTAWDSSNDWC